MRQHPGDSKPSRRLSLAKSSRTRRHVPLERRIGRPVGLGSIQKNKKGMWEGRKKVLVYGGYMSIGRIADTKDGVVRALEQVQRQIDQDPLGHYKPRMGTTNLYFIQGQNTPGGPIKIGLANNVDSRLRDIQACSPIPLHVLHKLSGASREVETSLHVRFGKDRLHGEWFTHRMLKRYIEQLKLQNIKDCLFLL